MQNVHKAERQKIARDIASQFAEIDTVEAVTLGGSLAAGQADARSDIDLYVYSETPPPLEARARLIEPRSSRMELDNHFWDDSDFWLERRSGIKVEAVYEGKWLPAALKDMFANNRAHMGYSTVLWHSVATSGVLFDRNGWFASLQKLADAPYPAALADAIVRKNFTLLRGSLAEHPAQITAAVERKDVVFTFHLIDLVLASYFDVLFALNRILHPGAKRQLDSAEALALKPEGMREDVTGLVMNRDLATVKGRVDQLIDGLEVLLGRQGAL